MAKHINNFFVLDIQNKQFERSGIQDFIVCFGEIVPQRTILFSVKGGLEDSRCNYSVINTEALRQTIIRLCKNEIYH